jgi:signal transduction histidine kinase
MVEFLAVVFAVATCVLSYQLYTYTRQPRILQAEVDGLKATIEEQKARLDDLKAQISLRDADVSKCDAIILKLRRTLAERDEQREGLEKIQREQANIIANLRGQINTSERAGLEGKALFATISSVAYDLVFVLNEEGIVIALNKAADALFGARNPIGEKLSEALDAPDLGELVERSFQEDDLEEQLLIDGRHYRARTKVMRYTAQHTFVGVALQDITQLVRLNRARRDMVANISHELRTPITNIRLTIEGLFREQDKPKRKASISSLRSIQRETDSLLWLVQELMDLSMIETGQAIMKLYPVRLADIINDAAERMNDMLKQKEIQLVLHVPAKIQVVCDWDQTRRVLINLIHNAIKWSPVRGSVTVSAGYEGEEEVLISVFDNGPGVPDNQRERIFERFYQVDTSRSQTEGSGLGLAICKHIVEAHGGRIWAEGNSLGGGGRFFFTLISADESEHKPIAEMLHGQHDFLPLPSLPYVPTASEAEETFELIDDETPLKPTTSD